MNNPEDEPKPKRRAKTDDKSCTSSAGTSDDMVGDINDIILFMYFFSFHFRLSRLVLILQSTRVWMTSPKNPKKVMRKTN